MRYLKLSEEKFNRSADKFVDIGYRHGVKDVIEFIEENIKLSKEDCCKLKVKFDNKIYKYDKGGK